MIHFSCSHCGMKFQVPDEFAGRSTLCPTCKQPLLVPADERTEAYVPPAHLGGTLRSLAQAGVEGGVTLDHRDTADPDGRQQVRELLARRPQSGERYAVGGEIARGGMGVVLRAVDCDIRREVAVKFLLSQADAGRKQRFVEEAQITGQLEHPNIVPIHELTIDAQGRLFFSMKMVRGRSLAQVLDALRNDMRTVEKEWPLGRLLNVLVGICNALDYAHSRGVIHRDLKPANIMVGDFGEVYVMDWGLAKVLKDGERGRVSAPSAANARGADAAPLAVVVTTSRADDADLTQEGTVMGTPVYMPPEQAAGQIHAIDQRSDIYSLGAILYEMLALRPPIDKEGGHAAILRRVVEGEMVPPERENRWRARTGRIPRDLSAVALKALSKLQQDRYANVEALRRDVERFQEGRSVSARVDSKREALVKFVKRNRTASVAAAVVLVVLLGSMAFIVKAWLDTNEANAAYRKEQEDKQERTRQAVPAFIEAARLAVDRRRYDNALTQVNMAIQYDPENVGARLLKGQLLIVRKDFAGARAELERYLKRKPADVEARKLKELCGRPRPEDAGNLLLIAQVFTQQEAPTLAEGLLREYGLNTFEARKQLLELYRKRIEAAWPGLGERLTMDNTGLYALNLENCQQVTNLDPLESMPLTKLQFGGCKEVRDLTPLKGMPLTWLSLTHCGGVRDLSPLQGMALTFLYLHNCKEVSNLSPLKGMPLTCLSIYGLGEVRDFSPLKGMPLTSLDMTECSVRDLSLLKGMPLTHLSLGVCASVQDLSLLRGMSLTELNLYHCTLVEDLSPLKGMPLISLTIAGSSVKDLRPLEGMNLQLIRLSPKQVTQGINILRRMKSLRTFRIDAQVQDISAEEFWKKYDAGEFK